MLSVVSWYLSEVHDLFCVKWDMARFCGLGSFLDKLTQIGSNRSLVKPLDSKRLYDNKIVIIQYIFLNSWIFATKALHLIILAALTLVHQHHYPCKPENCFIIALLTNISPALWNIFVLLKSGKLRYDYDYMRNWWWCINCCLDEYLLEMMHVEWEGALAPSCMQHNYVCAWHASTSNMLSSSLM